MIQQNIFAQSLDPGASIAEQFAAEALSILDVLKGVEGGTNEDLSCAVAVFCLDAMRQKATYAQDPNNRDWLLDFISMRCGAAGGRALFSVQHAHHAGWQTSRVPNENYVSFIIAKTRVILRAGCPAALYHERYMPLRSIAQWRPLMLRALRGCVRINDPGEAMGYARQLLWERAEGELAFFQLRNKDVEGLADYVSSHWPGEAPVDQILKVN